MVFVRPGPFVVLGVPFVVLGVEEFIDVVGIFVELLSKISGREGISEILICVLLSDQY